MTTRWSWRATAVVAAIVVSGGCGLSGSAWDVEFPCDGPGPMTVRGLQIEPRVGERFSVSLCAYPDLGITWAGELRYDEDVLELVDRRLDPPEDESTPGTATAVFEFTVIGAGGTDLLIVDAAPAGAPATEASTFAMYVLVR